jgi:SAM-dependent methyltransferase
MGHSHETGRDTRILIINKELFMFKKFAMQLRKPRGLFGRIVVRKMVKMNSPEYEIIVNEMNIQNNDKILEIGYGPGVCVNMIAGRFNSCQIYGIDFSELMHKKASILNKQYIDSKRVHLTHGDFLTTHLKTSGFDKVFCLNVVYFWDDLNKPFGKICSLMKVGGKFNFFMAGKEFLETMKATRTDVFNKHELDNVINTLKSVGFSQVDYKFNKGYYIEAKK